VESSLELDWNQTVTLIGCFLDWNGRRLHQDEEGAGYTHDR